QWRAAARHDGASSRAPADCGSGSTDAGMDDWRPRQAGSALGKLPVESNDLPRQCVSPTTPRFRARKSRSLPARAATRFSKRILRSHQLAHRLLNAVEQLCGAQTVRTHVARFAFNLLFDSSYANLEKLIQI